MSRVTLGFQGGDPSRRLEIDLAGTSLPAPASYVSLSLLHLSVPYTFTNILPSNSGLLLIKCDDHSPHFAIVNGYRHRYSWAIPFDQQSVLEGHFAWFANSRDDDVVSFRIPHFIDRLVLDLSFITPDGNDIPFPPTPAGKICTMELLVRAV